MQPGSRTMDGGPVSCSRGIRTRTCSFGTGGQLGGNSSLSHLSASLQEDILPFFSRNFYVSIWIPSDSNKPITRRWVCAFRINIPTLILINSTLFFPSIIAMRWVMLSILFPTVLSGSRIKASSLVEQKSYLFLKKGSHHYTALQHGPAHGGWWCENH